ncbi:MAG TPA: response regulator [Candidatus Eremiobacteraeota bacterium]|nr:MAG: Response regulator protein VraR [bacterium ADurb.Bin363]HPZ08079.1 response regulator [Candidatus Eremiobacteraeota bacterium]
MYCSECSSENLENVLFCENCGAPFQITYEQGEEFYHNRYRVISHLSSGQTWSVLLSYDTYLHRPCTLRRIYKEGFSLLPEKEMIEETFRKKVNILSNLRHPNLPFLTDYFMEKDFFFIVTDYINGRSLERILKEAVPRGLPEKQVLEWSMQICRVLEYLNNYKPVIMPGNLKLDKFIIRDYDKTLILVDFGVKLEDLIVDTTGTTFELSKDIYSLGLIMYELLTNLSPYKPFKSVREIAPFVSSEMESILMKCLSEDVDHRFEDAIHLKDALLNLHKIKFRKGKDKISKFITCSEKIKDSQDNKDIKVFIVDDDIDICNSFKDMTSCFKDIQVMGIAHNGEDAVNTILSLEEKPDVILMDIRMSLMDGIEATEKILKSCPSIRIIILTANLNEEEFLNCFKSGASGYILKNCTLWDDLEEIIRKAFFGGNPISPEASPYLLKALTLKKDREISPKKPETGTENDKNKVICPLCRRLNNEKAKYCVECGINIIKFLKEGKLETAYDKSLSEKIVEGSLEKKSTEVPLLHTQTKEGESGSKIKKILNKAIQKLDPANILHLSNFTAKKFSSEDIVEAEKNVDNHNP